MDPEKLSKQLLEIKQNIEQINKYLQDLYDQGPFEDYCANLNQTDLAKLEVTLAFVTSTLCNVFFKLSPSVQSDLRDDHPIFLMMNRVKAYQDKVHRFLKKQPEAKEESTANRFQNTTENLVQSTINSIISTAK